MSAVEELLYRDGGAPRPMPSLVALGPPRPAPNTEALIEEVEAELARANAHNAPLNSAHEAYAALLEEVDELWDEVKKKRASRDPLKMRREAVQVAAMALRFVQDVLDVLPPAEPGPEPHGARRSP